MSIRGALIVLEGCDRSGKTTQAKHLVESLTKKGYRVQYINFPDRTTDVGKIINSYLMREIELSNEAIHLLFASNRWENKSNREKALREGITLIVDRNSFSGVAFSAVKGLDISWCKASEIGLLKPDLVLWLKLDTVNASKRDGYGCERYESLEFQCRVIEYFEQLRDDNYWKEVVADKPFIEVHDEILMHCCEAINKIGNHEIANLW